MSLVPGHGAGPDSTISKAGPGTGLGPLNLKEHWFPRGALWNPKETLSAALVILICIPGDNSPDRGTGGNFLLRLAEFQDYQGTAKQAPRRILLAT